MVSTSIEEHTKKENKTRKETEPQKSNKERTQTTNTEKAKNYMDKKGENK